MRSSGMPGWLVHAWARAAGAMGCAAGRSWERLALCTGVVRCDATQVAVRSRRWRLWRCATMVSSRSGMEVRSCRSRGVRSCVDRGALRCKGQIYGWCVRGGKRSWAWGFQEAYKRTPRSSDQGKFDLVVFISFPLIGRFQRAIVLFSFPLCCEEGSFLSSGGSSDAWGWIGSLAVTGGGRPRIASAGSSPRRRAVEEGDSVQRDSRHLHNSSASRLHRPAPARPHTPGINGDPANTSEEASRTDVAISTADKSSHPTAHKPARALQGLASAVCHASACQRPSVPASRSRPSRCFPFSSTLHAFACNVREAQHILLLREEDDDEEESSEADETNTRIFLMAKGGEEDEDEKKARLTLNTKEVDLSQTERLITDKCIDILCIPSQHKCLTGINFGNHIIGKVDTPHMASRHSHTPEPRICLDGLKQADITPLECRHTLKPLLDPVIQNTSSGSVVMISHGSFKGAANKNLKIIL
ncbi:hypothetical protein Taro_048822 [Colocasia esculenta]|uniref:Uncharacterized protein n=1 Tax=Colocasia esculenta TaxID=4460 RepID=A0A843X981_COLES|nr:hypothetical protein [Colocasia esculenta]